MDAAKAFINYTLLCLCLACKTTFHYVSHTIARPRSSTPTTSQSKCIREHTERQMKMDIVSISFHVHSKTIVHLFSMPQSLRFFPSTSIEFHFRVRHLTTAVMAASITLCVCLSLSLFCVYLAILFNDILKTLSVSNCCLCCERHFSRLFSIVSM